MYYEELYEKACSGDLSALKELESEAGTGNAEAQYVLSCVLDNPNSPYKDISLGMYWLKKSAEYQYEPAIQKIKMLSVGTKTNKSLDEKIDENYTPNRDFGTKNYHPNWTEVEPNRDKESEEEPSVKAESKAKKPSFGNFLLSADGRVSQSDYIVFLLIWVFFWFIASAAFYNAPSKTLHWLGFLLIFPFLQVSTKRCHDIGKWGMYLLIPFYFIYLLFVPGDKYKNEYGYPSTDFFDFNSKTK